MVYANTPRNNVRMQSVSIHLIAAPAGPRNIGVVAPAPPKEAPAPSREASAPARVENARNTVKTSKAPVKTKIDPVKATATNDAAKARMASAKADSAASRKAVPIPERAGGGDRGSTGTDVVSKIFKGLEFSDPLYLTGITNKIMANFKPAENLALVAEFTFEITRSGCVQNLKQFKGAISSTFNLEARTAIELASRDCQFGRLPDSWKDDLLRIHFVFDPKTMGR
jgi:hypothetical protein